MITYLKGDATRPIDTGGPRLICHVCNDEGKWGKGFVLALSDTHPPAEIFYRMWHKGTNLHGAKHSWPKAFELGNSISVRCSGVIDPKPIYVANMIAQAGIRTINKVPPIRYDALRSCLLQARKSAISMNATIHMPRIGCGLAGGQWPIVEDLINECMGDLEVYVYDLA